MIKGRRTRQGNSTGQVVATAPVVDDTASPKRKDFKYDNNVSHFANNNTKNKPDGMVETTAPMVLRGGRSKHNGIVKYLTDNDKTSHSIASDIAAVTKLNNFIDLTDENSCDSFGHMINCITHEEMTESPSSALGFNGHRANASSNIFLQEPVLSLNFDKTVSDKSRIIIKNSFLSTEIQTQFSPPKCDPMWGGNISVIPIKQEPPEYALDLSKPTQVKDIDSTTFLNHDSNSCDSGDSGVVIMSNETLDTTAHEDGKRRKPATPHRIVCPSPAKNPIVASPSTALAHLNIQNRRVSRKNAKSRRRLHTKELENSVGGTIKTESSDTNTAVNVMTSLISTSVRDPIDKKKPVLNDSVNPTAQQNTNNNQSSKQNDGPSAATATVVKTGDANKKLTDFFQVRRSVRKTKKEVQWERDRDIEKAIREERESGLKIANFEGKGRGIITTRAFSKGEFVVEYIGDLITVAEAKQREQMYAEDDNTGCYMYYFKHKNVQHCIDATAESGKLGRLVNHSRNGNLMTKTVSINNRPHLVLIAKEDIAEGVEVTYDYGDRSKEALQHHPWLAF
ncbi:histone-lysine N-methyltransferase PR-Set7 [Toxorhynchites rutilus septentrionalis]|uniref:histone-lysine N-methyltransferase PR-Set7 n=1 Tax=Toxorhynchites rutilus septentrionalis TaxID=329112 RepID=UPI00247B09C6|nr:histone-lysine N-methyltransferase PR-Set7 [Toxorhynchites rutilus septentrionalis]